MEGVCKMKTTAAIVAILMIVTVLAVLGASVHDYGIL